VIFVARSASKSAHLIEETSERRCPWYKQSEYTVRGTLPNGQRFSNAARTSAGHAFHPLYGGRNFIRYVGSTVIHSSSRATPVSRRNKRKMWAAACGVSATRALEHA
jgi:hypothetical protein